MLFKRVGREKIRVVLMCAPTLAILEPWQDAPSFGRPALTNLAGYLRQFEDFDIRLIDAKFEKLGFQDVLKRVCDFKPHIVGFSAYTNEIKPAAYQSALIKKHLPDIISVVGGVHMSTLPDQTMKEFQTFDFGVVGEGEITLHELCLSLLGEMPIREVAGIVYRQDGKIVTNALRSRNVDMDSFPLPAWDLLPAADVYYLQTERGCPFNCVFCVNPNGKVARKRSVENVIREMELLIETYHPSHINFGDELFSVDVERTHHLLDEMIKRDMGKKITWDCQTHVSYVDYDMFRKMKLTNVESVYMGVETGDEGKLKKLGKGTTRDFIIRSFREARRAKVKTGAFFIFGHPHETWKSVISTISLAARVNPGISYFGLMVPYPGTEISRLSAKGEGGYLPPSSDWDDYRVRANGAIRLKKFSRRQMDFFIMCGYAYVYLANFRISFFISLFFAEWANFMVLIKRLLSRVNDTATVLKKPDDYDEMFIHTPRVTNEGMVHAKENLDIAQKEEIKNIRALRPELILQQKRIG